MARKRELQSKLGRMSLYSKKVNLLPFKNSYKFGNLKNNRQFLNALLFLEISWLSIFSERLISFRLKFNSSTMCIIDLDEPNLN